jgi:hypothetical protein
VSGNCATSRYPTPIPETGINPEGLDSIRSPDPAMPRKQDAHPAAAAVIDHVELTYCSQPKAGIAASRMSN